MKFYQEITILSNPDISPHFIWPKLYTQLHIALANLKNEYGIERMGVSFPNYKRGQSRATLGTKLRIFSSEQTDFLLLDLPKWLNKLSDYVHIKSVQLTPADAGLVTVRRIRTKSLERKIKDYAKYKGIDLTSAAAYCQKHKMPSDMSYPFIELKSQGNGHNFKLSISQESANKTIAGTFNTYGINNTSHYVTVPNW